MSPASLAVGTSIEVRVPASSANLGPGFDSVGLALGVWDTCVVTITERPGLVLDVEGEGAGTVPRDETHLVVRTMHRAWAELGARAPDGLHLACHNEVPHGRGMGSSATAIVAGITAAQGLLALARGARQVVDPAFANDLASRLEGHPDNASASVFGGATLSWTDDAGAGTRTVRLPLHPGIVPVVFAPAEQLSTAKARSVLPATVRLADAAANSARSALLVHALGTDPAYLLAATREWLHQEPRRSSYAASMALVDDLRSAGHAAVISGAGPSVLVLTTGDLVGAVTGFGADGWRVLTPGVPSHGAVARALPRPGCRERVRGDAT